MLLHGSLKRCLICIQKIRCGYDSWKRWVFSWRRKDCSDDDEMTASGRPFQTWAAATGKARLPTVDSLMGGMTRRLVLADRRARRPGRSETATRGPRYRGALSCRTLYVSCTARVLGRQPVQCRQRFGDVLGSKRSAIRTTRQYMVLWAHPSPQDITSADRQTNRPHY